jgi:hypothetical protein
MKNILILVLTIFSFHSASSQVLLSLLFGDKLNSPKIEFGLEGGVNFSTISNLEGAKNSTDFNLGFYFDFLLKNPSLAISTGVIVKSSMGAEGLDVYSLNDEKLDNAFAGGHVNRKIQYFNVPIALKYKFDNHIYVKAGTQLGLLSRAYDEFKNSYNGEDLEYKNNIRDQVHVIDAGLIIGAGYKLMGGKGMHIGVNYYYGLVTVMKGSLGNNQYNRSFYITAGIPIGKGKSEKRAAKKKSQEENIENENK